LSVHSPLAAFDDKGFVDISRRALNASLQFWTFIESDCTEESLRGELAAWFPDRGEKLIQSAKADAARVDEEEDGTGCAKV
jgi:hypothetical protein